MRRFKALGMVIMMAAGLTAAAIALRDPYARLVAERWKKQVAAVADDRVDLLLGQVAQAGDVGIVVLADALGSQRKNVATAAQQILGQELSRWQNAYAAGGVREQAILAEALANCVAEYGPSARDDAADLAGRILLWLPDCAAAERSRILTACEKVLAAANKAGAGSGPAVSAGADQSPWGSSRQDAQPPLFPRRGGIVSEQSSTWFGGGEAAEPEPSLSEVASLPGGGLPIDPPAGSSVPQPSSGPAGDSAAADRAATAPQLLNGAAGARPLGSLHPPRPLTYFPDNQAPRFPADAASNVRTLSASNLSGAAADVSLHSSHADLAAMETLDVMRRLRAKDTAQAAEARDELLRRGLGEVHLDLARRLFDPDPEVRKKLAKALPGLQSIDAIPWLLWLACDEDPDVRLVAIGLMATTADPAVRSQIEKMARDDADPRIQDLADRLGRQNERLR